MLAGAFAETTAFLVVFGLVIRCGVVAVSDRWNEGLASFKRVVPPRVRIAVLIGIVAALVLPLALVWRWAHRPQAPVAGAARAAMVIAPVAQPTASSPPDPQPQRAPAAAAPGAPFKRALAVRALDRKWREVAKCRRGKASGKGWTTVTFAQDGSVSDVVVDAPFGGTPTAGCIADVLSTVRVDPFNEATAVLPYRVYVQP